MWCSVIKKRLLTFTISHDGWSVDVKLNPQQWKVVWTSVFIELGTRVHPCGYK